MLRKRSRSRNSKQALMADYTSQKPSTDNNYKKPTSLSFFNSPRLFTGFASIPLSDTESSSIMSPTSILDTKPYSAFKNPLWPDPNTPTTPKPENRTTHWDNLESRGLGLVDALIDEKPDPGQLSKPKSRMVLFGSQLKIQIPTLPPHSVVSPSNSPKSPADFGMKTRNSQLNSLSPRKSPFGSSNSGMDNPNSPWVFTGCLSVGEMELFEDYTRVITYGPNPRTTHIFDDCIVESCCGVVGLPGSRKENWLPATRPMSYPSESFLSFCYNCRKNIGQGKDIFIYRLVFKFAFTFNRFASFGILYLLSDYVTVWFARKK